MPHLKTSISPNYISLIFSISFLTGCASITGTTNQNVSIQAKDTEGSEIIGASCELTNSKGKWFTATPGSIGIARSNDDLQVLCKKDGYDTGRTAVVSDTKGMMFGNIIFGGGIGAIVDHNTGAAYEYPSFFQVLMRRLNKDQSQQHGITNSSPIKPISNDSDIEKKLIELKNLHGKGLISNDVLLERQRLILGN